MNDKVGLNAQAGLGKTMHIDIEALTNPVVLLGHPVIGRAPQLRPGTYTGRIIAMDMAKAEDRMAGIMARLAVDGTVMIEHIWQMDNLVNLPRIKAHSWADMINPELFEPSLPERALRDRHHKRKPQPNRGPRGGNQW